MTEGQKDAWSGVVLGLMCVALLLGGLLLLTNGVSFLQTI